MPSPASISAAARLSWTLFIAATTVMSSPGRTTLACPMGIGSRDVREPFKE
jgi:hypothetical protein